jgi:hypothetical protein
VALPTSVAKELTEFGFLESGGNEKHSLKRIQRRALQSFRKTKAGPNATAVPTFEGQKLRHALGLLQICVLHGEQRQTRTIGVLVSLASGEAAKQQEKSSVCYRRLSRLQLNLLARQR